MQKPLKYLAWGVLSMLLVLTKSPNATTADTAARGFDRVQDGPRVALVIGNNAYQYVDPLKNAVNDAKAIRSQLKERGFDVVEEYDANRQTMNRAINTFLEKLSSDSVGVFYYSGHGIQIQGANYLIPIDLKAGNTTGAQDVNDDAIELGRLLERASQAKAKFMLAVIDACRDNPFKRSGSRAIGSTRGLAPPTSNASGIMVVYAAGANQQALDSLDSADKNPNGLFTREFIKVMSEPGLTMQAAINKVKNEVIVKAKTVNHMQTPAIYDESIGQFCFVSCVPIPISQSTQPSGVDPAVAELRDWEAVKDTNDSEQLKWFLEQYPSSSRATLVKRKLQLLKDQSNKQQPAAEAEIKTETQKAETVKLTAESKPSVVEDNQKPQNITAKRTFDPPFERYQDNGDGTVTDTKTGLMWKRCQEGQTWNNNTCEGTASKIKWIDAMPNANQKSWPKFAGHTDWRMPSMEELATLVYCSTGKPQYLYANDEESWKLWKSWNGCAGDDYKKPTIAQPVFPNTPKEGHPLSVWSSSVWGSSKDFGPSLCWCVSFYGGTGDVVDSLNAGLGVRLVRAGQ